MCKKITKRVTIIPPIIMPSSFKIKLRRNNERLLLRLQQLEQGSLGIEKWFNHNKS